MNIVEGKGIKITSGLEKGNHLGRKKSETKCTLFTLTWQISSSLNS